MAGASLPLWTGAVDAETRAARAAVAAAERTQDDRRRLLALEVLERHVAVETALRRLALYNDAVLPLARQGAELREAAYAAGRGRFTDLLDAERILLRAELDRVRAMATVALALADLQRAVGKPEPEGHNAP
jgi:cobalt-zinc-cadmium efflux system outer membrane protein